MASLGIVTEVVMRRNGAEYFTSTDGRTGAPRGLQELTYGQIQPIAETLATSLFAV